MESMKQDLTRPDGIREDSFPLQPVVRLWGQVSNLPLCPRADGRVGNLPPQHRQGRAARPDRLSCEKKSDTRADLSAVRSRRLCRQRVLTNPAALQADLLDPFM